jgi:hypothetical protein
MLASSVSRSSAKGKFKKVWGGPLGASVSLVGIAPDPFRDPIIAFLTGVAQLDDPAARSVSRIRPPRNPHAC